MPSPRSPTRHAAALEFLIGRINYERVAVLPYGEPHAQARSHADAAPPPGQSRRRRADRSRRRHKRQRVHFGARRRHARTPPATTWAFISSPHLERLEERFAVNGQACSAEELVALVDRIRPVVEQMDEAARAAGDPSQQPTFFEMTTAIALMHFADRQVDLVVLEVGLGGRLDSTNVCQPAVAVITSISLDHTRQLGDTTAKIAAEKGGIIKPGVPVLLGPLDGDAHGGARRNGPWSGRPLDRGRPRLPLRLSTAARNRRPRRRRPRSISSRKPPMAPSSCATPSCGCWAGIRPPTRHWRWPLSWNCAARAG